jgi:Flp pilus assembly protein TadG
MVSLTSKPARPGLARAIKRFRKSEDGATAVEFAMVSVPFLGLLFAIFETAFVFFVTEALESATANASRTIMTGQAYAGSYASAAAFRDGVICPTGSGTTSLIPSFITCSNLIVDIRTAGNSGATSFTSADVSKSYYTNPSMNYCIGSAGDVVVMRVVYPMPVYLTMLSGSSLFTFTAFTGGQTNYTSADGTAGLKHMIMSTATFRNEPFGTQTLATGCS